MAFFGFNVGRTVSSFDMLYVYEDETFEKDPDQSKIKKLKQIINNWHTTENKHINLMIKQNEKIQKQRDDQLRRFHIKKQYIAATIIQTRWRNL